MSCRNGVAHDTGSCDIVTKVAYVIWSREMAHSYGAHADVLHRPSSGSSMDKATSSEKAKEPVPALAPQQALSCLG